MSFETRNVEKKRPEREHEETKNEKLDRLLTKMALDVNQKLKEYLTDTKGNPTFVDETCRLNQNAFRRKSGGMYSSDDLNRHAEEVGQRQREFALEAFCPGEHNPTDNEVNDYLEKWREWNKYKGGDGVEKLSTILLHKILGEDYAVLRTCEYDDYVNSVDQLVVNLETGEVVCAFDEVLDEVEGNRYRNKVNRAKRRLKKDGGMSVAYGFAVDDNGNGLKRAALRGVPAVCLSTNKRSFHTLMRKLTDCEGSLNSAEVGFLDHMINQVRTQLEELKHVTDSRGNNTNQFRAVEQLLADLEQKQNKDNKDV